MYVYYVRGGLQMASPSIQYDMFTERAPFNITFPSFS
jgi:hypothetical protein